MAGLNGPPARSYRQEPCGVLEILHRCSSVAIGSFSKLASVGLCSMSGGTQMRDLGRSVCPFLAHRFKLVELLTWTHLR